MPLKMNLFRVVFKTDDATPRNRSFFEVYLRQFPQHDYKFSSATFNGESAMIASVSIAENFKRSALLLGTSATSSVFSAAAKYTSSAEFEGESNMIIGRLFVGVTIG